MDFRNREEYSLVKKQAKRNKNAIWYKVLVSHSREGMLLTFEQIVLTFNQPIFYL